MGPQKNEEDKENVISSTCRKVIIFPPGDIRSDIQQNNKLKFDEKGDFSHPVYKEISFKNGQINKSDLSTLKKMCRDEHIDSSGKRPLIQQRLKTYFKNKMLKEAGILQRSEKFDYFVIVDFEATCEEKNAPDYPHEIIEFPGVIVDGKHWQSDGLMAKILPANHQHPAVGVLHHPDRHPAGDCRQCRAVPGCPQQLQ